MDMLRVIIADDEAKVCQLICHLVDWHAFDMEIIDVVNYIISPDLLENKIKDGAGLLNPLNYYLRKVGIVGI